MIMNKLQKNQIIEKIEKNKIIAIIRGVPKEKLVPLCDALYKGGIRILELTYSADGSVSDTETASNIKMLSEHFKDKLYVGAGTVITKQQVKLTRKAGGLFIISPNTDKKVIKATVRQGLISIPGALTPSEACEAKANGADFVKLFPMKNMGSDYVKAIKAPLSHIKFLAVGGIDENNMGEYLKAKICGFGVGANIINKKMVEIEDWDGITELAKKYMAVIEEA